MMNSTPKASSTREMIQKAEDLETEIYAFPVSLGDVTPPARWAPRATHTFWVHFSDSESWAVHELPREVPTPAPRVSGLWLFKPAFNSCQFKRQNVEGASSSSVSWRSHKGLNAGEWSFSWALWGGQLVLGLFKRCERAFQAGRSTWVKVLGQEYTVGMQELWVSLSDANSGVVWCVRT